MSEFNSSGVQGVGLGLRRDFFWPLFEREDTPVDFLEIAPENWVNFGGRMGDRLRDLSERYPFLCHGLSLDLGGSRPLDTAYISALKSFFDDHQIVHYTEHLSYCGDSGHLYDLLPIPFTEEAVHYVAGRIREVQDRLERKIGIENVSFYALPSNEMTEVEFINAVVAESSCGLLFDVNNTYVNSINHSYDAEEFMRAMPSDQIMYLHMAGHFDEADDLKIDTHGQPVKEEVWRLLERTYEVHGVQPTLLERDFNIPPLVELLEEVSRIREIQQNVTNALMAKHG